MKVTVFGITGYTGRNLARELRARGHSVTGVARTRGDVPDGVTFVEGSIFDENVVALASKGADVFVVAVRHSASPNELREALPSLLAIAERSNLRLGIIGGAASLFTKEHGPRLLDSGFPDAWRPEAEAAARTLEELRESDTAADWFYVSPAEVYGSFAPGQRRGTYRLGRDVIVRDADGQSVIGGEDLAVAVVDELETPAHHKTRFTLAY